MPRPILQIIAASTRPGRKGIAVAAWLQQLAERHGAFDVELVDLAKVALPFLDEPHSPRLQRYTQQHTRDWSESVSRADAYVIVTPEYNHSFPASLKNALDYLSVEWEDKPVAIASYGGVAAGTRAATALKPVLAALKMVPALEAITVPYFMDYLDDDGAFAPPPVLEEAATDAMNELLRLHAALHHLRSAG